MIKIFKGSPRYFSSSGQLDGFAYLMLTLPFKCNYRCPKCFNLENDLPITSGISISLKDILQKIREAKELGGKAVVIAGEGEPTLDTNIREIISTINNLGMIPVIYSNGSTLTNEMTTFYFNNNTSIVIAIDSLNGEIYNKLTGRKNMLPKVLKNIENVRSIYANAIEKNNENQIVSVAINATVCSLNTNEIKKIKEFCGNDIYFVSNPLAKYGNAIGNWHKLTLKDEDFLLYQKISRELSESAGPLTLDSRGLCGYSINGIGIGPYGDYMTCAYTSKTNGLLGNIRDLSLVEAYNLKYSYESKHYKKYGNSPCLIRNIHFIEYLESASAQKHTHLPDPIEQLTDPIARATDPIHQLTDPIL